MVDLVVTANGDWVGGLETTYGDRGGLGGEYCFIDVDDDDEEDDDEFRAVALNGDWLGGGGGGCCFIGGCSWYGDLYGD